MSRELLSDARAAHEAKRTCRDGACDLAQTGVSRRDIVRPSVTLEHRPDLSGVLRNLDRDARPAQLEIDVLGARGGVRLVVAGEIRALEP